MITQKEMYLEYQINQLRAVYRSAQARLVRKLASTNITAFDRARSEKLLTEIEMIVTELNKEAYSWAKKSIPVSYDRGIDFAAERLKKLKVTRFVSYDAQIHTSAVATMIDDVTVGLMAANNSITVNFTRFIRQTQQKILQDEQISKTIAEGLITGETRRAVSDTLLQQFREKMDNEQFIVINGKNYQPEKYAELVARTRTREATSTGTINTALRYGVDLVEWDAHSEICDYCAQYAGRVYSISGQDEDFPQLTEQPPLHPNCRCNLEPVTREALEDRGQMDNVIELSNKPDVKIDSYARFQELITSV